MLGKRNSREAIMRDQPFRIGFFDVLGRNK
jgi:hypothetical protein